MTRPRLLDLFCGAGGCSVGYHRAGFDVVGVDIKPQPNYPFDFIQGDWAWFLDKYGTSHYDAIHASPPCQAYSSLGAIHGRDRYVDLYDAVRQHLQATGLPWVIENVIGAPYRQGVLLCGSMFPETMRLRRHRNFETSVLILSPSCRHDQQGLVIGAYGHSDGDWKEDRSRRGYSAPTAIIREVMGMPWAQRREEITQAIPPAYTEWIGRQLIAALEVAA